MVDASGSIKTAYETASVTQFDPTLLPVVPGHYFVYYASAFVVFLLLSMVVSILSTGVAGLGPVGQGPGTISVRIYCFLTTCMH